MATAQTYLFGPGHAGANREDLLDLVTMITPWDTPFFTSAPKTRAYHVTHDWVTDSLAATSTGGTAEGASFSSASLSARSRKTNVTQIFRKDVEVSNTQQAVNPAGVKNEYQYQIQKALKEIARNIESRVFAASGASATGDSTNARVMKNLNDFITTNVSSVGTTASSTPLSETDFNNTLEAIYTAGGNPESCYVSPGVKRDVSGFTGSNTRNIAASDKRLVAAVDVYDSDFGLIQVVLDRFIPQSTSNTVLTGRLFFLERAKNRIAFLRPLRHIPMAPVADAVRGMVLTELTLEVLAEDANGILARIKT